MSVGKQRGSGAQRKGVSKKEEEGDKGSNNRIPTGNKKKRGRKQAATRAIKFARAGEYLEKGRNKIQEERRKGKKGKGDSKTNNKLSFSETVGITEKRHTKFNEVTNREV